jgi:hypothetical protein
MLCCVSTPHHNHDNKLHDGDPSHPILHSLVRWIHRPASTSLALAGFNSSVGLGLSHFFIKPDLQISGNNYHYETHEAGKGPVAYFLMFKNKGASILYVEVKARVWRPDDPSKSPAGVYLPLNWRGRNPSEESYHAGIVWDKLIKNDTAFAWLANQRLVNGVLVWEVPFEAHVKNNSLTVGDEYVVDIRVSWHKGEEEKGEKVWSYGMKVMADVLVIEDMPHVYFVDMSKLQRV